MLCCCCCFCVFHLCLLRELPETYFFLSHSFCIQTDTHTHSTLFQLFLIFGLLLMWLLLLLLAFIQFYLICWPRWKILFNWHNSRQLSSHQRNVHMYTQNKHTHSFFSQKKKFVVFLLSFHFIICMLVNCTVCWYFYLFFFLFPLWFQYCSIALYVFLTYRPELS